MHRAVLLVTAIVCLLGCRRDPNDLSLNKKVNGSSFSIMVPIEWDVRPESPDPSYAGGLVFNNYRFADRVGGREVLRASFLVRDFRSDQKAPWNWTHRPTENILLAATLSADSITYDQMGHVSGNFRDYRISCSNGHTYIVYGASDKPKLRRLTERVLATLDCSDKALETPQTLP